MENFCWEWDVLREMTRHVDTGQPLPKVLFDRMLAAKNFQSGLAMLRQIEFAVFDMRLHSTSIRRAAAARSTCSTRCASRSRCSFRRIQPLPEQLRPHLRRLRRRLLQLQVGRSAFGGRIQLFEETGVLSPDAGARFRDEILAVGGSRPAAESFRAFRGREPSVDALLRHNGMTTETARPEARDLERQFAEGAPAAPARLARRRAAGRDVPAGDEDRGP